MILFDLPVPLVLLGLFLLGAVLGSFLNVCIHRIPQHERFGAQLRALWSPPSCCPRCGRRIPRHDNIPILGWILLGGRCRFCRGSISVRYPLIELLNAVLLVVLYVCEIPLVRGATVQHALEGSCLYSDLWWQTIGGPAALSHSQLALLLHVRYLYHVVLIEALLAATFIDFDHWIIPDGVTLPAMLIGLAGGLAFGRLWLLPVWFENAVHVANLADAFPWLAPVLWTTDGRVLPELAVRVPFWIGANPHWHGLAVSLAGLAVGGGVVWLVRIVGAGVLRREAMGFGDVVLMAMIGSFLGWQATLIVFLLAPFCALGTVIVRRIGHGRRELPFGPYLSLAALLLIVAWRYVWPRADRIFELGSLLIPMAVVGLVLLAGLLQISQLVKRMLGIALDEQQWEVEWTSADQLTHFAGEKVDPDTGGWRAVRRDSEWPGTAAGRGLLHQHRWRSGTRPQG